MNNNIAIRIENLGKRYRYGGAASLSSNLRADITDWVKGVFSRQAVVGGKRAIPGGRHQTLSQVHERHILESPEYFWALKDINLEIKYGEVVGIIGRNGAGKSTLLKILSRITQPTTGKISYFGRMASLLEVGTGFHRELTGRENIYLNGSILGMRQVEIRKQFDNIVAFSEVEKFIDTPVKFYSSGMYVRLAFAVAAHLNPDILLVDEVLAVGDMAFQAKCLGKMGEVAKAGITVIFVSHNMSAVENLCQKAALLVDGRLEQYDETSVVISSYMNRGKQADAVEVDLSMHPGRHSEMHSIIKKLRFLNQHGVPCSMFKMGESVVVEVTLQADESIRDASLGIGIETDFGLRVLTFITRYSGITVNCPAGQKVVVSCTIKEFPLVPGVYHFKLALDKVTGTIYDSIDNAGVITVAESNYYGGGSLPSRSQGIAVARVAWESKFQEGGT